MTPSTHFTGGRTSYKRIGAIGACLLAACIANAASVSGAAASVPSWGFEALLYASFPSSPTPPSITAATDMTPIYVSPLLARETKVYTDEGIPAARASQAIDVESEIARSSLMKKLEERMAGSFAGVWFEPTMAQLHVGVTSRASQQIVEKIVAGEGLTTNVTATLVRSTWAQLEATQRQWNKRMASLFRRELVETALSPQRNAVEIILSSSVSRAQRLVLQRDAGSAGGNVFVNVVPRVKLGLRLAKQTACKFEGGAAYCDPPITSGVTIETASTFCTAGPAAIPKTKKLETYLLTAGHCGAEGESFSSHNVAKKEEEIGKAKTFVNNATGDYGEIAIENAFWKEKNVLDPVFALTAEWGAAEPKKSYAITGEKSPAVNETSCFEGEADGQDCGKVLRVNMTIAGVEHLNEMETKFKIAGGDSGGPNIFIAAGGAVGGEAKVEGILTAENTGTENELYEPIGVILSALNLELLTTANEVRPPCS